MKTLDSISKSNNKKLSRPGHTKAKKEVAKNTIAPEAKIIRTKIIDFHQLNGRITWNNTIIVIVNVINSANVV